MPLTTILKFLSAAKFPLVIALFGLVLTVGGSNRFFRLSGAAAALMAGGATVVTLPRAHGHLAEIRQLQLGSQRREAALKTSLDMAMAEAETLAVQLTQMNAGLADFQTEKVLIAGQLETLENERRQLIYDLHEMAMTEASLANNIDDLEVKFNHELSYQLSQKRKLKSEVTQARAAFHTEIAEAQAHITGLETALTEKTELATQMLTELEAEATGTFTHFSNQAKSQNNLINDLCQQIEALKKTNTALTYKRFEGDGPDAVMGNRLIDYLAEHQMAYAAFSSGRERRSGHLKITLDLIETTLRQARESLVGMETALNLWAPPKVKIHGGRHVFTLVTERFSERGSLQSKTSKKA